MIGSIILLLAFCIIYVFIIEIFTVLFRLTGLSEEKARFEVISLLTSSGYTTNQSEMVTISKRRRKLASITMIFGYVFSLIIVSSVVNIFLTMSKSEVNTFLGVSMTAISIFLVIFAMLKSKRGKHHLDLLIHKIYNKLKHENLNTIFIVDMYGGKVMARIHLTVLPEFLQNTSLEQSNIKYNYGIQVLIVRRKATVLDPITGDTLLQKDDDILVFGQEKVIKKIFTVHEASH